MDSENLVISALQGYLTCNLLVVGVKFEKVEYFTERFWASSRQVNSWGSKCGVFSSSKYIEGIQG